MIRDFQRYLVSIRAAYGQWWELYTLTDAQDREKTRARQSVPFDFGLRVQTVKREERERRDEEKVECFPVLEGIRKYADHHVLLVGRPGSGKSTALARLLLEEATAPQARIPVLVELRYWQGSIEQLIRDSLTRHDLPNEQVEAVLQRFAQSATAKETLILFDGVNELPSEEARSQLSAFRRNHPKVPMIFTTRDLSIGGDLGIEKKLEMQPLTPKQMKAFIRSYLPEQAEEMLAQLKDRLREFGQTPLLLWMLCGLFQQTGTIPENLGLVFREFTQGYERYLKEDVRIESDREWWKPVLQQLAWVMMQGEKPTEFRVAIQREEAVRAITQFLNGKVPYAEDFARKCLRDLQKHHLIQTGTNPEELEFRHQLIQEYYAAESVLNGVAGLEDELLKRDFLNYLKWTEPVALMLALVEDETQTIRVVKLALEVDWRLGARLAGEVKREFQGQTVGLVNALNVTNWLKVQLLGETRSDCAIASLLKLLEDSDFDVRSGAESGLCRVASKTAIPGLLQLLEHSDSDARSRAVFILSKIKSETAVPGLLQLLKNFDSDVRQGAASALGGIGSETAVPGLLQLLKNFDSDVRQRAAFALGRIGSETAVPGLLQLLEDSDFAVRQRAAFALGEIGSETALPDLLQLLKNFDSDIWGAAEAAVGMINMQLLEDSGFDVWEAAKAAGDLDVWEAAEAAGDMCQAGALGDVGSKTTVNSLLQLLEDSDLDERRRVAEALSGIAKKHTNEIVQHLPHLLTLISTDAREEAFNVILAIQENCKYYNYKIYRSCLEAQKNDRQKSQTNDRSTTINNYINQLGNLNTGTVNIAGDQIGVESSTPDLD